MANLSISMKGDVLIKKVLDKDLKPALSKAVFNTAAYLDTRSAMHLDNRIYGNSPSPNYKRTGRSRGTKNEARRGGLEREVRNDSRLKGAKKNYNPFLNRNRKISKLNTNYWDDAVKETRKKSGEIFEKIISKFYAN